MVGRSASRASCSDRKESLTGVELLVLLDEGAEDLGPHGGVEDGNRMVLSRVQHLREPVKGLQVASAIEHPFIQIVVLQRLEARLHHIHQDVSEGLGTLVQLVVLSGEE